MFFSVLHRIVEIMSSDSEDDVSRLSLASSRNGDTTNDSHLTNNSRQSIKSSIESADESMIITRKKPISRQIFDSDSESDDDKQDSANGSASETDEEQQHSVEHGIISDEDESDTEKENDESDKENESNDKDRSEFSVQNHSDGSNKLDLTTYRSAIEDTSNQSSSLGKDQKNASFESEDSDSSLHAVR